MSQQVIPQVIILTGCASGIGRHMAEILQGHRLILTDIDLEPLHASFTESDTLLTRQLDVREAAAWEAVVNLAVEKWGRLDVLMNIAGYLTPAYLANTTPEEVDLHIDINAKGLMYGTLFAIKPMLKQKSGHIINVISLAGLSPVPGLGLYSASKFAARSFSLTSAIELRDKGIAVTAFYPDAVQTPMLDKELGYDEAALTFSAPRILNVEEVGKTILWIMDKKPLEVSLPRHRGWLAKVAGILPRLGLLLRPILTGQGQSKQRKERQRREGK